MPTSAKARSKRAKILKAASALFSKKGFQDTTLSDIGKKSKMGKASIYYYFPEGKGSIFAAAVQEQVETLFVHLVEDIQAISSPREKLCHYLHARIHHFHLQIMTHGMVESVRAELMPLAEVELRKYFDQELELVEVLVRAAVDAKEFRDVDCATVARILQAGMKGLTTDSPIQPDVSIQESQIKEFINLTLGGLNRK